MTTLLDMMHGSPRSDDDRSRSYQYDPDYKEKPISEAMKVE